MSKFLVETSARHVHLTEETFKVLFGENATLTIKKELSQPGQYACEERVTVVGPKKALPGVSILGPYRKADQVEISLISISPAGPINLHPGVLAKSPDSLITPAIPIDLASVKEIKEGVIVAKRHIHATVADAKELNVSNGEIVKVKIETDGRSLIFDDVVVRVSDSYALAMHIDTDESNAACCGRVQYGEIVK